MVEIENSKVFLIQISSLNTFSLFICLFFSGKDRLRLIKFQLWTGGRGIEIISLLDLSVSQYKDTMSGIFLGFFDKKLYSQVIVQLPFLHLNRF